jgi:ketosteroid isomerase-like protein
MSRENLERLRENFENFLASGDMDLSLLHPDVEWHDPPDFPDRRVHYGPDGAITAISTWVQAWEEWSFEVEDYLDAGDEVVVVTRQRGRGKDTGISVEQPMALVYKFREDKAVQVRAYFDIGQALEAVGRQE